MPKNQLHQIIKHTEHRFIHGKEISEESAVKRPKDGHCPKIERCTPTKFTQKFAIKSEDRFRYQSLYVLHIFVTRITSAKELHACLIKTHHFASSLFDFD